MKNNIKKALKEEFGQNAHVRLTLIGVSNYPDLGISCPQYLAVINYVLDGFARLEELIVDTVQTRMGLEAGNASFYFEDEEVPF